MTNTYLNTWGPQHYLSVVVAGPENASGCEGVLQLFDGRTAVFIIVPLAIV